MKNKTNTPELAIALETLNDFKTSVLIVSVVVNLFVLTTWLVAQSSGVYASQLTALF